MTELLEQENPSGSTEALTCLVCSRDVLVDETDRVTDLQEEARRKRDGLLGGTG